jgi:hypothetical protein
MDKSTINIQRYGKSRGIASKSGEGVVTFEILSHADQVTINDEKVKYELLFKYGESFSFNEYTVATFGRANMLPYEAKNLISNNHILPEILKKQARYMYGQGPFLYVEEEDAEMGIKRIPVTKQYQQVMNWLASWKKMGLKNSFADYAKQIILEYYYSEGVWSKYRFNKSRRALAKGDIPIRGLEIVPNVKARLVFEGKKQVNELLEDEDYTHVMVGRWDVPKRYDMEVFPRFDESNPFKNPVAVNYVRDFSFGEDIYSTPTWFYGLKEWIKSSNLNPKYLNSYLKNSLNAKLHVLIPDSWIKAKETTLRNICTHNQDLEQAGKPMQSEYEGLKDIGTIFDYSMIQKLIDIKLQQITEVLSGEGENQGKVFFSRTFRTEYGVEEWEFKEIPTKYKEFVDSIINIDKRSVSVILEGVGLDPSISNVTKDGVFQGGGSDAYYNYIIYLNSLTYAEEYITRDINTVLQINFPELFRNGVKLGFYRYMPPRQQETSPDKRIEKTVTN